jgi:ferrous iron transport protein A
MSTSFTTLIAGDRARVSCFQGLNNAYRNRLLSLGLTPGTEFTVKRVAPLGDPVEIVLRGFRLSLRREEAAGLMVEKL